MAKCTFLFSLLQVNSSTNKIVVHAKDLKIKQATFESGETKLTAGEVTFDSTLESATLPFNSELPLGQGTVHIEFEGVLNTDLVGAADLSSRNLSFLFSLASTDRNTS